MNHPILIKITSQSDEKHFVNMDLNVIDQTNTNEKRYFFQNQRLLVNSRNLLLLTPIIATIRDRVPNIEGKTIYLDYSGRPLQIGNSSNHLQEDNWGCHIEQIVGKGTNRNLTIYFKNPQQSELSSLAIIQSSQVNTPQNNKQDPNEKIIPKIIDKLNRPHSMEQQQRTNVLNLNSNNGSGENIKIKDEQDMIQGRKVNQDRSLIPSSNVDLVRAQSIVNSRDTFINRPLSLLSPNQKNQVQQQQQQHLSDLASSPSGAVVPENLSIQPISREKRVQQRKIGYVLEKVNTWRQLYSQGYPDENGTLIKMNLDVAATYIGLSRQTLDDYYQQIKKAQVLNFQFSNHLDEKMGFLRSFVKERSGETRKYRGSLNIQPEEQDDYEQEDGDNMAPLNQNANLLSISPNTTVTKNNMNDNRAGVFQMMNQSNNELGLSKTSSIAGINSTKINNENKKSIMKSQMDIEGVETQKKKQTQIVNHSINNPLPQNNINITEKDIDDKFKIKLQENVVCPPDVNIIYNNLQQNNKFNQNYAQDYTNLIHQNKTHQIIMQNMPLQTQNYLIHKQAMMPNIPFIMNPSQFMMPNQNFTGNIIQPNFSPDFSQIPYVSFTNMNSMTNNNNNYINNQVYNYYEPTYEQNIEDYIISNDKEEFEHHN